MKEPERTYTPEEELEILRRYRTEQGLNFPFETLEELVTSPRGFALGCKPDGTNTVTPLQRAIMRILEGRPLGDLASNKTVQRALGLKGGKLPEFDGPPAEVDILAAVRGAKSLMAAATALNASQTCDLTGLAKGEIPRYSIVSLEKDNAAVTYGHLVAVLSQPDLVHLRVSKNLEGEWTELIKDSGLSFSGSVFVWHPSGRPVEIRVTAGKRAGGGLISRWSIGLVLDEAPRMLGEDEAVVNYTEARRAVRTRLRDGAQILSIGSPHRAQGPVYERFLLHWGAPTKHRVIIKANGPSMNPTWWTAARIREIREEDPDAYKTDVLAEFLEPVSALIHPLDVSKCTRDEPMHIEYQEGHDYTARMDPATRRNAWTFAIGDRVGRTKRVVYHREWRGTSLEPLSPRAVLTDIAKKLREYHLDWLATDQWSGDSIVDIADDLYDERGRKISFSVIIDEWPQKERKKHYKTFGDNMADQQLELPPDPLVAADIRMIQKRPTQDGFSIVLPKTGDGRHCDYAPTIVGLFKTWLDEELELPPHKEDERYGAYLEAQEEAKEVEEFERQQDGYWWENPYSQEEGNVW
jgi:hypothetical protein